MLEVAKTEKKEIENHRLEGEAKLAGLPNFIMFAY